MSIENLIENVDNQIINIRTKSLDVSFNELYDMYQNEELIISPDYQRLFRWGEEKQSRFVESLLLEMPVPPIFVIETGDGIYELIDGLQRISSYLHFRGIKIGERALDDDDLPEEDQSTDMPLVLHGCDIVSELNGLTFDNLPKALQIKLKRSFVRMEVIKKESEPSLKYHMFKRLNTGGELLSAQEIRNCTIRLLGSTAIDFLDQCSKDPNFQAVIQKIGTEKLKAKCDQELVLRFFAIKNDIENYRYPVREYLTQYLEKMTDGSVDFDYKKETEVFRTTFKIIWQQLNDEAFSSKTHSTQAVRNDFVLYYFDGITVSIARLVDIIDDVCPEKMERIKQTILEIKYGSELQAFKTGTPENIKNRIELFTEGVRKVLDGE